MYSNEDLLVIYLISSAKAYTATNLVLSLGYIFPTVNFLILAPFAIRICHEFSPIFKSLFLFWLTVLPSISLFLVAFCNKQQEETKSQLQLFRKCFQVLLSMQLEASMLLSFLPLYYKDSFPPVSKSQFLISLWTFTKSNFSIYAFTKFLQKNIYSLRKEKVSLQCTWN